MIEDTLQEMEHALCAVTMDVGKFRKGEIYLQLVRQMNEFDNLFKRYTEEANDLIGGKDA